MKFYRTTMVIELLGTEPYTGGLTDLSYAAGDGDYVADILAQATVEVPDADMRALLRMQGSAEGFLAGDDVPDGAR